MGHEFLPFEWAGWWLLGLIPLPEPCRQQCVLGMEGRNTGYLCRPRSLSIKCFPLSTFLIALSFFHIAGQFASPCVQGYLHPTPPIPASSKTRDTPSSLQFQMLAPLRNLHTAKWVFLYNSRSSPSSRASQPCPPAPPSPFPTPSPFLLPLCNIRSARTKLLNSTDLLLPIHVRPSAHVPHVSQQESVQGNPMVFHRAAPRAMVVSSAFHDPPQNYRQGLAEKVTPLQSKAPVNLSPFSNCLLVIQSH